MGSGTLIIGLLRYRELDSLALVIIYDYLLNEIVKLNNYLLLIDSQHSTELI